MDITVKMTLLAVFMLPISMLDSAAQDSEIVKDKDISVIEFEEIGYPPLARIARVQGVVVVRVKLDKDGNVEDAKAISGSDLLIPACLTNAKKWRFLPNPEKAAVVIYNFTMPGAACASQNVRSFSFLHANLVTVIGCEEPVETSSRPH